MLDDFFAPIDQENDRIAESNRLLKELKDLGYDFDQQRQILRGELEAPAELAERVAAIIAAKNDKPGQDPIRPALVNVFDDPDSNRPTGWREVVPENLFDDTEE
jgi:hypothetical protein